VVVATVVVHPAAAAATVAAEAPMAAVVGVHMPVAVAADHVVVAVVAHIVAVEVALTKKSLNLWTKGPSGNSGRAFLISMSPFVFFFLDSLFQNKLLARCDALHNSLP
jgi:hypothetical protein